MPPLLMALAALLLPAAELVAALADNDKAGSAIDSNDGCTTGEGGGACSEESVEMAEEAEAATLRTEMLQLAVRQRDSGGQCDDGCQRDGEQQSYSCRNRIEWVMNNMNRNLHDAILRVDSDCVDQCFCTEANFDNSPSPPPPPAPSPVPSPSPSGRVRVLTFNVWYGNNHFAQIADLITDQVDPDFANLQEAVNHQPWQILHALNNAGGSGARWDLANPWNGNPYWCGLNYYRSDRWFLEWHREIGYQADRGVCGARFRRFSDGLQYCVWGTHPVWRHPAPPHYAAEGIRVAGAAMQECSADGAASIFTGDMNTMDYNALKNELQSTTGWGWQTAAYKGYDQIFTETSPQNAGTPSGATVIAPYSGQAGCQADCQNPAWAFADHPPVYVDLTPR